MLRKSILAVLMAAMALGAVPAQTAEKKTPPLLKAVDTIELPAVSRFVAKDAFTKANGIAWTGESVKQFILPLVEEGVEATTLTVSELTRDAKNMRIASALNVDERGEVSLAHFFQLLTAQSKGQAGPFRTDGLVNVAYIICTDGNTWAVDAWLSSDGWSVHAHPLGDRLGWDAGRRFLSR